MGLDGIYGKGGSGKSLLATIDAKFVPKEIPIYTNYKINLKNAELIEPEEIFEVFIEDSAIPAKLLITDEAYGWIEARGSGNLDLNKYISYMIFQSRKRGLNWRSIAQLRGTLDLRWRGLEDRVIYCHKRNLDTCGNSTDDFNFSMMEGFQVVNFSMEYEKAKPFFSLYDTRKTIMPQEFKELDMKIKFKRNPTLLNGYVNDITDLIIKTESVPSTRLKDGTEKFHVSEDWVRDKILEMSEKKPDILMAMDYIKFIKVRIKGRLGIV